MSMFGHAYLSCSVFNGCFILSGLAVCLELQCVPEADWQCPYCKDYFGPGRKTTLGETAPSAPRPIFIRLKRVVKAPTTEIGGCVVCR